MENRSVLCLGLDLVLKRLSSHQQKTSRACKRTCTLKGKIEPIFMVYKNGRLEQFHSHSEHHSKTTNKEARPIENEVTGKILQKHFFFLNMIFYSIKPTSILHLIKLRQITQPGNRPWWPSGLRHYLKFK